MRAWAALIQATCAWPIVNSACPSSPKRDRASNAYSWRPPCVYVTSSSSLSCCLLLLAGPFESVTSFSISTRKACLQCLPRLHFLGSVSRCPPSAVRTVDHLTTPSVHLTAASFPSPFPSSRPFTSHRCRLHDYERSDPGCQLTQLSMLVTNCS